MAFGKGPTEPLLGLWVTSPPRILSASCYQLSPSRCQWGQRLLTPAPRGKELREGQELGVNITATLVKPKLV